VTDFASRSLWHARRLTHAISWPGMAGIVLGILCVLLHVQVVLPWQGQLAEIKRQTDELRGKVAARRTEAVATDPAGQLAEFYAYFPNGDAMADTLDRVYAAAAQENILLEQGEYRLASETAGRLMRYDIVLPVKGPYPKLRRFIARALRENPSLALESVSFGRQSVIAIGVEAQVRMTLYLGKAQ
jgi:hypothetical protein